MLKKLFEKFSKKTAITIICLILVATVAIGATLAYVVVKTAELINSFKPGEILVVANDGATFTVPAESDADAYIRVMLVVNYQDAQGNVYRVGAVQGTHYDVTENLNNTNWLKGNDGYYYYKAPVSAGSTTTALPVTVTERTLQQGAEDPTANGKYSLTVVYVATGVQASPSNAVEDAWGVTLNETEISSVG